MKSNNKIFTIFLVILLSVLLSYIFIVHSRIEGMENDNSDAVTEMQRKTKGFNPNVLIVSVQNANPVTPTGNSSGGLIGSIKPVSNLPLSQYFIKSSYNSAVSGDYVSKEMLTFVIKRGCRFLDFQIDYVNNVPCVVGPQNPILGYDQTKVMSLNDIYRTMVAQAFTVSAPNAKDPLIVHMRVNGREPSIYNMIAGIITTSIGDRLYEYNASQKKFDVKKTTLDNIMGKVVILMSRSENWDWRAASVCPPQSSTNNCYSLINYVNADSGTDTVQMLYPNALSTLKSVSPFVKEDNMSSSVQNFKMLFPEDAKNVGDFQNLVLSHGFQVIAQNFSNYDNNINDYEEFFNTQNLAFVPISTVIKTGS